MSPEGWDALVRAHFVKGWLQNYDTMTLWAAKVIEISLGSLIYLFDGAPSMSDAEAGDDRVVAVWGHSVAAKSPREKDRQAGFIPVPEKWSHVGMDRGHFVAHAAGGGMDMNFFPQAKVLPNAAKSGRPWSTRSLRIPEHRCSYDRSTTMRAGCQACSTTGCWSMRGCGESGSRIGTSLSRAHPSKVNFTVRPEMDLSDIVEHPPRVRSHVKAAAPATLLL
jgi:hypothetical protein